MNKKNRGLIAVVSVVIALYVIQSIYISVKYTESVNRLERQQQIIEVLQQENASLHDSVWHLNQALEGEGE